ncbi:response regulator transcription factor [Pseudenhygromyxa sp. WMMC2535]|uniref:response regulator transcription factor n=1 Tax=Pseudenhygromyxa sp. WMMC2535 TaxID=2712867 RepID=UPI0015578501|nr:response regulator transcription factor [Pseudenhygromyxa sp. WMMC2535]NVB37507.1 response regulator transcription factor [Pseudenhygromyxa sp. WMMC2535]
MKLLLVEDEDRLARVLTQGLREEGHQVDLCTAGAQAQAQARDIDYDAIILDWMLPDVDGVTILRRWRDAGMRTPVLMLTARGSVGERVTGLKAGADDYLVKPFAFAELLARLEALHRRGAGQLDLFRAGPVSVDGRRRVLTGPEGELDLTAREFALACELFSHVGEVVARSHLLGAVWGSNFEGDPNVLDVYVGYLRGKLARVGKDSVKIKAVRGVGFRLLVDASASANEPGAR